MEDERKIPIVSPINRRKVDEHFGSVNVFEALKNETKSFGMLPGYNSALAVVERLVSKSAVEMFMMVTQEAARAGVDLALYRVTSVNGESLVCTKIPMDGAQS